MFYDDIRERYLRKMKHPRYDAEVHAINKRVNESLVHEAKVFFIDEMILDSLMNVDYDRDAYREERNLPFPSIFFEFGEPVPFVSLDGTLELGGLILNRLEDVEFDLYPPGTRGYTMRIFDKNTVDSAGRIHYNDGVLSFQQTTPRKCCLYDMGNDEYWDVPHLGDRFDKNQSNWTPAAAPLATDDSQMDFRKMGNFMFNTIAYINAQNVVVRRVDRHRPELDRLNRKRQREGLRSFPQLRPYYFVEVKKIYVDDEPKEGIGWTLNYRVWVRGHNRHYQDGACIWIDPYVKGPLNAPWKHNRYLMLYDRFRHLLANPRYR